MDSAPTRPPCASTICLTMARPMPAPPLARARDGSTRCSRSQMSGSSAGGIESPVFSTAQRSQPDFTLDPQTQPHVERICTIVQGTPLAIILAAAWLDSLTIPEIVDEISRGMDILETEARELALAELPVSLVVHGGVEFEVAQLP